MRASEMGSGSKEETEKEDMEEEKAPDFKETQVKGGDPTSSLPGNNHGRNVIANVHLQTGGHDAQSLYNSQKLDDANIGTNVDRVDGDNKKVGKLESVDNNSVAGQDFGEYSPPKTNNNTSVGVNSNETSASKNDGSPLNQLECVAADERSSEIKAEINEKGEKLNDASVIVESACELSVSEIDGSHAHPANQPECVVAEEKSSDIKTGIDGKREKSGNGLVVDVSCTKHSGSKNDGTHEHTVNQPETAVVDERSSETKAEIDDKGEKPNGISVVDVSANGLSGSKDDRSHVPPLNQVEIAAAHAGSTDIKVADDDNGEKLNDEAADMELFQETELKESKPEMDVGRDVSMKSSNLSFLFEPPVAEGDESGTEEEQAAFVKEVENFYKERNLEFKHPKFYKEDLNLLKLWRAVIKLGGYEEVTSCKLWRQVGESFNPPKTCTTVSWTFRIFYEKALLEYEKCRMNNGEHTFCNDSLTEPSRIETQAAGCQALGSGRARRDAAARAMQGWHSKRLLGSGEVCQPIIKDKNSSCTPKSDRQIKNIGFLKRKKPSSVERTIPVANLKAANPQSDTMVIDIGPPADWVKINVKRTSDCFEVYALVPGLLREEVHVQSDPAGRLVISGQPEQLDNPWGVTPFKKVVSLPSRIDPHQTSAVVTLHGQLFVRVPYEQSDM